MPLSAEDALVLVETLRTSLHAAGYADAADQLLRVANEPLHPDELDDPTEPEALRLSASDSIDDDPGVSNAARDEMLIDPTPTQRLSAAVKLVDLMVVEPLRLEAHVPTVARRVGLDVVAIGIGDREARIVLPAQVAHAPALALGTWTALLSDLRAALSDAEADNR